MKTVIIDDDIFFSDLLKNKLKKFGFTTNHQFEYAQMVYETNFHADVIFVDYHLKDEKCSRLLSYLNTKHAKAFIILMSNNEYADLLAPEGEFLYFFKKSKIKYLKFRINYLKKRILKRREGILQIRNVFMAIPVIVAIILILMY